MHRKQYLKASTPVGLSSLPGVDIHPHSWLWSGEARSLDCMNEGMKPLQPLGGWALPREHIECQKETSHVTARNVT